MKDHRISRRAVLAGTAAAGALGVSGFPARAQVNWKKYAGTKLEVILAKGPRGDILQKYIKEFTDLTGIKVDSEQIPEQQQRQKAVIELASGKPSFDVIHLSYHVQKRQFEKAGWLADISRLHEGPEPDRAGPRRKRFLGRRPAPTPRTTRARCSRCRGRSTTSSSTTTRRCSQKEGVAGAEDLRRDGRRRRKADRREGRHLRLRRARPAQRQHDAVDQLSSSTTAANSSTPRATS